MLREAFSDSFAQRENYLTAIDARIKLAFVFSCIGLVLTCGRWQVCLFAVLGAILALLTVKIPFKIIMLRLTAPLGFTAMVFALQFIFIGTIPVLQIQILDLKLTGYSEGLRQGIITASRVIAAVSLIIFLSLTTSFNKLLSAAGYFRLPRTWVEIAMLTYRYIFVLLEDVWVIRDAQRVRLGYSTIARSLRSIGELAGSALIRAYDHSLAVQEAMQSRLYLFREDVLKAEGFKDRDWFAAFVFVVVFLMLLILSNVS